MNILTFDVEEWFHLLDNDSTRTETDWKKYDVRIYENMDRIFRILEDTNTKATFFIIGWIAKTYPDIVKRIAEKYEVGSHTMNHQLVWQQGRKAFVEDVKESICILEDITGKPIKYFRAPGFSIRESETWAFEELHNLGIEVDCSVFPAHHAHGGMPRYPGNTPGIIEINGIEIKELPVTYHQIGGRHLIFSGGGYFRLCPYSLLRKWTNESNNYLLSYIHPRDLDAGQPIIKELGLFRRFKSYYGLSEAERKLRKWLTDFKFVDVATAVKSIDWKSVDRVRLC